LEYPTPNYALATSYGGPNNSGDCFEDISLDMIPRLVALREFTVRYGDSVDRISIDYALVLGENNATFHRTHGGDGGRDGGGMTFGPGENYQTLIPRWWWGDGNLKAVDIGTRIQPVTRLGRQGDETEGQPWAKAPNNCLVGFAGFNESYITLSRRRLSSFCLALGSVLLQTSRKHA
jgi:hypothetical protein